MGTGTAQGLSRFGALRQAYDDVFQQFSLQVRLLQSLTSHSTPDREAVEEARRRVEQAHFAYRESRDLLADFMLSRHAAIRREEGQQVVPGHPPAHAETRHEPQGSEGDLDQRFRVECLAYHLWEEAARPLGKAEEHWYRAERLIHNTLRPQTVPRSPTV